MNRHLVAAVLSAVLPLAANAATPGDVASLIKSTPHLSAGEFHLGMPADKAIAQMKSSGLTDYTRGREPGDFMFQIRQVPNQTYVGGIIGGKGRQQPEVGLLFTMYPNPGVVTAIYRIYSYDENQGPTVGATLAALRKKYGQETYSGGNSNMLYWMLDPQGHPLSPAMRNRLMRDCALPFGGTPIVGFDPGSQASKVTQGADGTVFGLSPHSETCRNLIRMTARMSFSVPGSGDSDNRNGWDRVANGVVSSVWVTIYDKALDINAAEVSHDVAVNGLNRQTQQQIEKAKQRGGPDL